MESDLVKGAEHVAEELLPRDRPSDTRQASALARAADTVVPVAEAVIGAVDPGLEPLFSELESAVEAVVSTVSGAVSAVRDKLHSTKAAVAAHVAALVPPPAPPVVDSQAAEPQPTNADGSLIPAPADVADPAGTIAASEAAANAGLDPTNALSPEATSTADATTSAAAVADPPPTDDPAVDSAVAAFDALSPAEQAEVLAKVTPPA